MIRNSAILILRTFSKEESDSFEEFLESPYHNKNTNVIALYRLLKKFHPAYESPDLTKEYLFKKIFDKEEFKEFHIRNLFSDLNILAEKFLQHNHLKSSLLNEKILIDEFNNRGIKSLLEKKIERFEKMLETMKNRDQQYYENKLFAYDAKSFLMIDKTLIQKHRTDEALMKMRTFLPSIIETHLYFFVEQQRTSAKHDYDFLKLLIGYLEKHPAVANDSPLLKTYYYLCQCFFAHDDEMHFSRARQTFRENFACFPLIDKKNIYSVLQAYCMLKSDMGSSRFEGELLTLLLEMLDNKIFSYTESGAMGLNFYRNIIIHSSNLKKKNILEKFVKDNVNSVNEQSRDSIHAYSLAHLEFLKGNFEKALDYSNKVRFTDLLGSTNDNFFFKNDIKRLMIKCFYELEFFENAISLIGSHKHFVKKTRLMKEKRKDIDMHFLNWMNELIRLRMNYDEYSAVKLKEKVNGKHGLGSKLWMNEKIDELMTRENG